MELSDKLESKFRLDVNQKRALHKLKLFSVADLLFHFPVRYSDISEVKKISELVPGDKATIYGKISNLKTRKGFRSKIPMATGEIEDLSGKIKIIWFNQAYLAKMIHEGDSVKLTGRVTQSKGAGVYLANPEFEKMMNIPIDTHETLFTQEGDIKNTGFSYPVYAETRGITSRWFYHAVTKILSAQGGSAYGGKKFLDTLQDYIPADILKKYSLPTLKTSLIWIHKPKKAKDAESARKRFAFEEVFCIQLERQHDKFEYRKNKSFQIKPNEKDVKEFLQRFPFTATNSQKKSIDVILGDMAKNFPMSRLLEGDVGSGKTAVAATASYVVINQMKSIGNPPDRMNSLIRAGLQVAYMAPTEILTTQHFESFIKYFSPRPEAGGASMPINIGLITGSGCRKFPSKVSPGGWTTISRAQLLKWVQNGEIPILIGTHALIQKTVKFKNLALVVIDEQHRFGVSQRRALARGPKAEQTPIVTKDPKEESNLLYKDLSYIIRGILFDVKKNLGLGHKEQIYQRAFEEELKKRNINFNKEKQISIFYNKKKIGVYQPDFVIDEKIIVEFKALPFIGTRETKQLWSYLKGSEYKLAFLVNFGAELEIKRVIYESARNSANSPRQSASLPHLLSMTATPIPRTLALTIYGDLDLSLLDEMPAGRKQIITEIITPDKREETYKEIKKELENGRQLYVICPRIFEADPEKELALNVKSAVSEAKRLKKEIFTEYEIGVLHSKMSKEKKEEVMQEFTEGKLNILCATSVVEVGVNVPNATVIIIEGAERFGLAQLHQLRGRVIRSTHQAYCYIFAEAKSAKTVERLKALKTAKNGFELAELDLMLRGAGELGGTKQWGITDLGMEAIKNIKMVEAARAEAVRLIEEDPELDNYPLLKQKVHQKAGEFHFE